MFRLPVLICLALLLAAGCTPLSARPLVDVAIVDRNTGQLLPQYHGRGDVWVPGKPGHGYAVRLTNTSGERVLVVLSVDGVNAISGEDADPAQAGYVLGPWQSTEITGWRKSLDDVAQFYFTDLPDSYAARTGRPDNVGVIGAAVFREARPIRQYPHYESPYPLPPTYPRRRQDSGASPTAPIDQANESEIADTSVSADRAIARQRIGTGHGARERSPVQRTDFVRATRRPAQIVQLRYDAPARLAALGLLPQWQAPHHLRGPQPFPRGFVDDPPRTAAD